MNNRVTKINKHLQRVFGKILQEEADLPADVLVTIARVEAAANLKSATIWLYVNPSSAAQDVLADLKTQMYELQGSLNRALDLQPLPRISLRIDHGAEHTAQINKRLNELGEL